MAETTWTVNSIKNAARAAGSHWFDPNTMRFFGTQVLPTVYQGPGGVYFVTKDDQFNRDLPKRYTVRRFNPETKDISTAGEVASLSKVAALKQAATLAGLTEADVTGTAGEPFQPVTVLQQFAEDCLQHGKVYDTETCRQLIQEAALHHKLMEDRCSIVTDYFDADGEPNGDLKRCRRAIVAMAKDLNAEVRFSGDPRGCTVKLLFPDGFTNDFAKEGYCVPTDTD